jgi:hypothetical protein
MILPGLVSLCYSDTSKNEYEQYVGLWLLHRPRPLPVPWQFRPLINKKSQVYTSTAQRTSLFWQSVGT